MNARFFVAVALADDARRRCAEAADRLRATGWTGRWVPPANYHLTLAFLGAVDAARIVDVTGAVAAAAVRHAPFVLHLTALGGFPSPARPRVAWLGPRGSCDPFASLAVTLRTALARIGFSFDDDAVPHVTLARSRGDEALPPLAIAPIRVVADAAVLYRSERDGSIVRHEAIERFPLQG